MEDLDIPAALYFYEQTQKHLEYARAQLRAADTRLQAAEAGLAHAIDAFDLDEQERFIQEGRAWVHRIHECGDELIHATQFLVQAVEDESEAGRVLCQLLADPSTESTH